MGRGPAELDQSGGVGSDMADLVTSIYKTAIAEPSQD